MARCPAHEDSDPSLSIREAENKLLVHCFAGCSVEAICGAMGLKVADLFSEASATESKPRAAKEAEKQVSILRNRLTPRERVLPVTVIYCDVENLDAGIARALSLGVEGEIVQVVLEDSQ
jgi:hypothetical protein